MANKCHKSSNRNQLKPKKARRYRGQLVFTEESSHQAEALMASQKRSFNNLMEWLVEKEFRKLQSEKAAA